MTKLRTDFRVYQEQDIRGDVLWRIKSGGRRGDVVTSCKTQTEADRIANELNRDPWYLQRGDTRAERNK